MQHEELIDLYLEKILEANEKTNLTRISSLDEARKLHIEDSLAGLEELNKAPEGLYGDLGSGGGFPGVPLALSLIHISCAVPSSMANIMSRCAAIINSPAYFADRFRPPAAHPPRFFSLKVFL